MVEKDRFLVVVSVLEGRKFPKRPKHKLVVEARFDGELLATDAVDHDDSPDFTQELAWELNKKGLHQHRMQRTSIKVQCYAVDTTSTAREAIGYVVLDIRSAQASQTAKWYPLLHTKYQRAKPEVRLAIYLDDDKSPQPKNVKAKEAPQSSGSGTAVGDKDFDAVVLKPELNDADGYYQIGPERQCSEQFIMSITVAFAANLPHLIPTSVPLPANANGYFFYYSLLGNDVTNEPFYDLLNPTFPAERASVRIRSSADALRVFFSNQPGLQIHLCCGDQSLGSGEIPLNSLLKKGSTEIYMKPVTIEGTFELYPPNRVKQKLPPIPEDMKPVVGVSIILRREDQSLTVTPVKDIPGKSSTPSGHKASPQTHSPPEKLKKPTSQAKTTERAPSPLPPHEGSYTDTFDDSSVQEDRKKESESKKKKQTAPPVRPSETKLTAEDKMVPDAVPASQTTEVTSVTTQPTVMHRPADAGVPPGMLNPGTATTAQTPVVLPAQTHHFCCSIDLQGVALTDVSAPVNVFLRYTYPFFGSTAPILTQPPVEMTPDTHTSLPQSFCTFDFATSPSQLHDIFIRVPLVVEIWHHDPQRSQNDLVGVSQVTLAPILSQDTVHAVHSSGTSGSRQVYSHNFPVVSSDRQGRDIGQLDVVVSLEDWGLITTPHVVQPHNAPDGQQVVMDTKPEAPPPEPRETQEYKAAIELEMWKETQESLFENQLKAKELQHMKTLADEWRRRDKERELLVKKKLAEYNQLEAQLQKTVTDLDTRDRQLAANEQELVRLRRDLQREHESKLTEMREASCRMKEDCDHKVALEREKVKSMEEQVARLKTQLTEMEQKYSTLDREFTSYKEQQHTKPEVRLQSEINLLTLEKVELERKIDALTKSKIHYKQQWGRALKELARLKQKEQQVAHAELRRQQQELEHMRLRYLAAEEKEVVKAEKQELESIKSELNKLKEQEAKTPPQNKIIETSGHMQVSQISDEDEHIARLIEERDTLLRTGVYTTEDGIIAELDRQIRQAIAQKAS